MLIAFMLIFRDSFRAVEVSGPVNFIIFIRIQFKIAGLFSNYHTRERLFINDPENADLQPCEPKIELKSV